MMRDKGGMSVDFAFRFRRLSLLSKVALVLGYVMLIVVAATCLIPLIWMIATSFKEYSKVFIYPPEFIPNPVTLESYIKLFTVVPFLNYLINTIFIATTVTVSQVLFSSLAAYSFARLEWRGRDVIFLAYLGTMMIPSQVTLISQYVIISRFRMVDTYAALIVPVMFGSAFGTFLLRQFFMTLPKDLEDAARIDGCGKLRIYGQIIIPLSKPAVVTLAIFVFLWQWNDMMWPMIVINSMYRRPLALGITMLAESRYSTDWAVLMAGATVCVGPVIVLYMSAQRFFIEGIAMTGMK